MNICMLIAVKDVFIISLFSVCTLVASYFAAGLYQQKIQFLWVQGLFFLQMVTDL